MPEAAVVVDLADRAQAKVALAGVPTGAPVAIVGGYRSRRFARRNGVQPDRVYLVLPDLDEPVAVADITGNALTWLTRTVLTVPSGRARLHGLFWMAVLAARRRPSLLVRAPIGARIVIGVRR